ncbi:MAG: hypothetical protein JWO03_362 [Bacteroidetes bacterium]|nr:hypothetical protein [Bacteroidota bacterium]
MKNFLTQVGEYVRGGHPGDLQKVLLCFPNNRAAYFAVREFRANLPQDALMPHLITMEKWVHGLSKKALAQNIELINILFKVYKEVGGIDDFETFIPTAYTMLADFDEVDMQLVRAKQFFKDLYDIKSLNTFLEDEETLTEYSKNYKDFWDIFRQCYFKLQEVLGASNKAYNGMIYRDVAESIHQQDLNKYSKIYFVGFSGLAKSEQKVIAYLLDTNDAEFLVDADTYYLNDSRQEAGYFFREYKKSWKIKAFKWEQPYMLETPKQIDIIGVARNIGQAKLTGDILQNHLKVTPENLKDTVVVLLDEKLLQPLMASLPDSVDTVNITMGLPLSHMQLTDFMRHISDLQNNSSVSSQGAQRFYHRDVITLLQHTYFKLLSKNSDSLPEAIRYIRANNKITITKDELFDWFRDDTDIINILFDKTGSIGGYISHLTAIIDMLYERFITIGEANVATDIEVLFWLKKVLLDLQEQLSEFEPVWDIKSLQKLIENEIKGTRLPFESDKADGLQVMGILETRCLDYKNVIILSMNEGILPSGKTSQTFFPYDLRKGNMSTHKERDAIAAYLFYRLMQRAENVYLVYNTESDLLGGGEKSRFILQMQHELKDKTNIQMRERNFVLGAEMRQAERPIIIQKNEGVKQILKKYLSQKGLSPTALNSYINCTLQFYFKNILALREQDEIEEDMEASTIGSAVHYALEHIYKDTLNKPLTVDFLKQAIANTDKVGSLIREFLKERFEVQSLQQGKNYLLYNVCTSLVINFLRNEMKRVQELEAEGKTGIVILLEQEMKVTLEKSGFEIIIKGLTDRVDKIEGVVNIADYKTGDSKKGKIKIDNLPELKTSPEYSKAFQLMMYAWLYRSVHGKQPNGMRSGIYWLRHAEGKYEPLQKDKSDILSDATLDEFEGILNEILLEMVSESVPFTKTEDRERCKYCDFVKICARD